MNRTAAIIGGGCSGALLAVRLAEAGVSVILINRTPDFGLGVAYSTRCDRHLLNVRSGRMSARADQPDHFVQWLRTHHPALADPEGFAPRRVYGEYVQDILAQSMKRFPGRIETVVGEAVAVREDGVALSDGRMIGARAVVLATGNPPPRPLVPGRVIGDPWAPGALDGVGPDDRLAVIGTGLTMIDVLLALDEAGWRGQALALSRRGLIPRAHDAEQLRVTPRAPGPGALSQRLKAARAAARTEGWGVMMDRLRDLNADLWEQLDQKERGRFLRHLRPWWDVHRHRIAPAPAAMIERLTQQGRLRVRAGRVEALEASETEATLRWRPRSGRETCVETAHWVIDCSGPGHDPAKASDALTGRLLADGLARAAPLGLGLDVDEEGRLLDAHGQPSDRLFVLGPPARAAFWETVAVPDIRLRVEDLVRRLGA